MIAQNQVKVMSSRRAKKDKRRKDREKKRREGLPRKIHQGPFAGRTLITGPMGREKMSDVLKDFIEPYKDMVDSDEAQRNS